MGWQNAEAEKFTFENEGDELVGLITGAKETRYGSKAYDLTDASGNKFFFFGCAHLDRALANCIDKIVQIIFKGTKQIEGGKALKMFKIDVWKPEKDDETLKGFDWVEEETPF